MVNAKCFESTLQLRSPSFLVSFNYNGGGGSIAQWFAYLLPNPVAPIQNPAFPDFFQRKIIVHGAEVNQQRCLDESGQWLENVD